MGFSMNGNLLLFTQLLIVTCQNFTWKPKPKAEPSKHRGRPYEDFINKPLEKIKTNIPEPEVLAGTIGLDCKRLFDPKYKVKRRQKSWISPTFLEDTEVKDFTCEELLHQFYFPPQPLSQAEKTFPLAYALLVSTDAGQILHLLQAIYQPQNIYCLHVDAKADRKFQKAIQKLVSCFSNVFIASKQEQVFWAHSSILNAAMACLSDLKQEPNRQRAWKYVQILAGTDIPLKTNAEMVQILTWLNGTNDCELQYDRFKERYTSRWELEHHKKTPTPTFNRRHIKVDDANWYMVDHQEEVSVIPPGSLIPYKGSFAATLSSPFVSFLMTSSVAKDYLEWLQDKYIADEFYWPTLIHNLHIGAPGSFPAANLHAASRSMTKICPHKYHSYVLTAIQLALTSCSGCCLEFYTQRRESKPWISRDQIWEKDGGCAGMYTHLSCVYGVGDLPRLKSSPSLFAHKFYATFEPAARHCLLELHYNRTYRSRAPDDPLDIQFYKSLPSVRYHNLPLELKEEFVC